MKPETWVAIYAAAIGTSAFFLNLKAWWDSRPKLTLTLIARGVTFGGDPETDERDLVILYVTNRGGATTVITNMILFEMDSLWRRWRVRPLKSYVIPNPQLKGYPANIPSDLEPSKRWTGVIRKRADLIPDLHTGNFYTGVYCSHRDRPYLARIPQSKDRLPKGTKALPQ